jgi:hypothetical protein
MTNSRLLPLATLFCVLCSFTSLAQVVNTFEGIDASQLASPQFDVDPNGAVGTKQFMEWTNAYFQAYDKTTFAPVWSTPQEASSPWANKGITSCNAIVLDGMVLFDRLASRWVIAAHTSQSNNYNYCVAVSSTDDLTSPSLTWYTYVFPLNSALGTNSEGNVYFPDWPKIATWPDGYYVAFDLNDVNVNFREVGFLVCALDRANMLVNGTANAPICFRQPNPVTTTVYLGHSLIPADVEGTTAPPAGRNEFFASIENPVLDGKTTTSTSFNLWDFHVDWSNPANSTLTQSSLVEAPYRPGCYTTAQPANTVCVPEPSTSSTKVSIDSVGDRFMPRMSYRNFGSYESFLVSHTVQVGTGGSRQTGIRWYELRDAGSGTPSINQDGNISPDDSLYRFVPSIAEDSAGNAAMGYSVSSASSHPGINASYFSLTNSTAPNEIPIYAGSADQEGTWHWGSYDSMTVDPVDGCTFWYVNEYFASPQTGTEINWNTRIANFRLSTCGSVTLNPPSLSFNAQAIGTTSPAQTITLTNTQSETILNISSISFSGTNPADFSQTNTCGSSVAGGASCTISVTFKPGASGTGTAVLNVNDDAPNSPQSVTLSGAGLAPVTLSAASLNFGAVLVKSSSTAPAVTLTNNQSVALSNISITVSGSAAFTEVNTCGASIPALGQCKITVTFAPTAAGEQSATINIADSAANSPQTISVKGTGLQPVAISPTSLSFGDQTVGTTSPAKVVTLTNNQKVSLTFSNITITGADPGDFAQTNTCSTLAAGAKCTVSVTFKPSATGARSATLKFTDSAATSPQSLKLSGTGQ